MYVQKEVNVNQINHTLIVSRHNGNIDYSKSLGD